MTAPNAALRSTSHRVESWQRAAWDYYDTVGELRFATQWVSNALSRVNIVAAAPPTGQGDDPTRIVLGEEGFTPAQLRAVELVEMIAGGDTGQGQLLGNTALHLTIAGTSYVVAEPNPDDPLADEFDSWEVYSSEEIRQTPDGIIELRISDREWRPIHPNALVVRAWRRHPRWSWQPDAPTRGVLGVLREIQLLQEHIHASAQSRLAGAGILVIPSEAVFPPGQGPQSAFDTIDPDDQNVTAPEDNFVETLVDSMTTPIVDRGSAAAVVPLVVRVPGEFADKIEHLSFATPFDDRVLALLESAIKRLALGLDIPPEILTGAGGLNHWTAWQVEEQAITLHIEPLAEVITHALTIGYLRPALEAEGYDPDEAMVWFDASQLTTRPDRTTQAIEAYDRMELSAAAMLREVGLSVDDMPSEEEKRSRVLLSLALSSPDLAPAILADLGMIAEPVVPVPVESVAPPALPVAPATQGPPEQASIPAEPLLAACDVLVHRALERAGSRLRSAAGKRTAGGAASVPCDDPSRLHCTIDATAFADLGQLLDGAWSLVPDIAGRYSVDPERLTLVLDRYARALLATGEPHAHDRLGHALAARTS
jgi:hypothetical protein